MSENNDVLIQLEELGKVFYADEVETHALAGVHLQIRRGEFLSIEGPSGCGKSTLLSIIGFLDTPTAGRYLFKGEPAENLNFADRARIRNREIGFIFQAFNLIGDLTVFENVELPLTYRSMGRTERRRRAEEALERVGMSHRLKHYPSQLSGGQQQRVAVARALAGNPSVLLADEPTGNLDSKTSVEVMGVFQKLNEQGITIVMVTHELDIARYCKRNLILRDGRLVRDELVPDRLNADVEMKKLKDAEAAAKLTSG